MEKENMENNDQTSNEIINTPPSVIDPSLITQLTDCGDKKSVEECFSSNGIEDLEEKIRYLKETKGTRQFYTPNYKLLNDEDKYSYELSIFLSGKWKKRFLYDKLKS